MDATKAGNALTESPEPSRRNSDLVFQAKGVTKVYAMGEVSVHALRGVDLKLHASEFLVLLGPSGSGKSTLLNILGGLDLPTKGSVSLPWRGSERGRMMRAGPNTDARTWASCSSSTT